MLARMPWLALLPAVAAAVAMATRQPELTIAVVAVPAMLWLPGRGFARRLSRDPLERVLLAFWVSAVLTVVMVAVGVATGLGGAGALATAATLTALGERIATPRPSRWHRGARLGALAAIFAVAGIAFSWRDTIARPLDRHWWFTPAESSWENGRDTIAPTAGAGWRERRVIGWPEATATALYPRTDAPFLLGPADGPLVLALRGPVGATMSVADRQVIVAAAVEERTEEGPVDRYLASGTVGMALERHLDGGERLQLHLSDPAHSVVYLLAGPDAVWSLHATGELRYVNYYQILNMVEQVHWARELFGTRRVTDVQPPLPSYVLAAPLAVGAGEVPTTNVVFVLELAMVALAGVAAIRAWAPRAPTLAYLLPAAAAAEHAKLMLEAGSAMLPDTLYTLALLGTVASLARPRGRYAGFGLLAQLTRYPGTFVAAVAGLFAGAPRRVGKLVALVVVTAAAFGIAGWLSGSLDGWLDTVWWETVPEHWHGEAAPGLLLSRIPRFAGLWLGYAGGLPLLAALRWPRGTRVCLGTAIVYAGLLCTIDHTPSHYFLPLLQLAVVAAACTAAACRDPRLRAAIPAVGVCGLIVATMWVPVVG
jgi:hypothetical protein